MIKKIVGSLVFAAFVVAVFNLLDYLFDRFVSHGAFTFDSLSNIVLPLVIAAVLILFAALYKKLVK